MNHRFTGPLVSALALGILILPGAARAGAETGFYAGGSIGQSTIEADVDLGSFDDDDTAWKLFGGWNFGWLPFLDVGIEGSYRDFGEPSDGFLGQKLSIEATSWDLFGYAGLKFGPFGVFGKLGNSWWDADAKLNTDLGSVSDNDSGNDPAWGLGARFQVWSLQFRAEYEEFDIGDTDDVSMWSLGAAWTF
jgi:hypothetical protein